MADPAVLDKINSIVDAACFLPAIFEIRQLVKVKNADCESLFAHFFYVGCFFWWCYYYVHLNQPWTFYIILLWGVLFAIETGLVIYYKAKKHPKYLAFIDTLGYKK